MELASIDCNIVAENVVRFIDAFVHGSCPRKTSCVLYQYPCIENTSRKNFIHSSREREPGTQENED
ncbi:MAG: hypothetical protein IPO27_18705 [Bacteroidetes bacterium]|nr:hypothetical protein [Bacteroidota bacterium]